MFFDLQAEGVMQTVHSAKLHIAPPVFHGIVEKGFPFLGNRKPLMGLRFQIEWFRNCPQRKNSNSISSGFLINIFLANQLVKAVTVTFRGIYVTFGGNITTLRGHSVTFGGGSIEVFCATTLVGMALRMLCLRIVTAGNWQFSNPFVIVTSWGMDVAS
jgi:hypothetical protein